MRHKILILTIVTTSILTTAQATQDCNKIKASTPISIDDLPSLNIVQYLWTNYPPQMPPECLTGTIREPTRVEVYIYEALCGKGPEIRFKASSSIGFVYLGEDNDGYYLMILCQMYPFVLRRVQDYVVWIVPDAGFKQLTRNETVLSLEDLKCFANSVDVIKGGEDIGYPICYKK